MPGFIADIWSGQTLGELKKRKNLFDLTDRSYEAGIKSGGGSIIVPSLDSLSIADETADKYEIKKTDNSKSSKILLDKKAVITIGVGVVDEVQANSALMQKYTKKAGVKTGRAIDVSVAKEIITGAKAQVKFSDIATGVNKLTKMIVLGAQEYLNDADADMEDRILVVDAKGYKDLGGIADFVDYQKIGFGGDKSPLKTGLIGTVYGFSVYLLPALPKVSATGELTGETIDKHTALFFQKEGIATAIQAQMKAKSAYDTGYGQDVVQLFTIYGRKVMESGYCVTVRDN